MGHETCIQVRVIKISVPWKHLGQMMELLELHKYKLSQKHLRSMLRIFKIVIPNKAYFYQRGKVGLWQARTDQR